MPPSAAFLYGPDGYETAIGPVIGRRVAGEEFLRAVILHAGFDRLAEARSAMRRRAAIAVDPHGVAASGAPAQPKQITPLKEMAGATTRKASPATGEGRRPGSV